MEGKVVYFFGAIRCRKKRPIVKEMLTQEFGLEFSISACNRPKRENEVEGERLLLFKY